MRKILLIITLTISFFSFAQEFQFEEVVKVDSTVIKNELFNRARYWSRKKHTTMITIESLKYKK